MESPIIIIITVISTLIGAISPIVVALIQSKKNVPEKNNGIFLPENVVLNSRKSRMSWGSFLLLALLGGIMGYVVAKLITTISPHPMFTVSYKDGEIVHNENGSLQTFSSGVNLENFDTQVEFFAPSNAPDVPWNFAILFRVVGERYKGYRVWINANNNSWGYSFWNGTGFQYLADEQQLPSNLLLLKEGEKNYLRLVVFGDNGCFYLNNKFVSMLNVSDLKQKGNVSLGLEGKEYQFKNGATRFSIFTVNEIDELDCPK